MIISKKETPVNNASVWTKSDRKSLKSMVKDGKSIKEIADALGRTPAAVTYQKSTMGLSAASFVKKIKKENKVKIKTKTGEISMGVSESPRDKAKKMTSVARQIARANGKRITMAMFFVEDL